MNKEKIILSFVAALVGILVAGIAFYFYQTTKEIDIPDINTAFDEEETTPTPKPSPKIEDEITLTKPSDFAVVDKSSITISGKVPADSIVLITSDSYSILTVASAKGEFTSDFTLENGVNAIKFIAFLPDGKELSAIKTITYSSESF